MPAAYQQVGAGDYTEFRMVHDYETDQGLISVPIAGDQPSFVTIRVHGGIGFRNVNWTSARSGKPPIIPSVEVGNALVDGSDQLRNYNIQLTQQPNQDQNGFNWTITGQYRYVQEVPRRPGVDVLPTNSYPFAIEPMVSQSSAVFSTVSSSSSVPAAMLATGSAIDFSGLTLFFWPHTFHPPQMTSDYLVTTVPSHRFV